MSQTFSRPKYDPAISAAGDGQQAVQSATYATRGEMAAQQGDDPAFDIAYEAYKLSQEAMGLPAVGKHQYKIMYRYQQLFNR